MTGVYRCGGGQETGACGLGRAEEREEGGEQREALTEVLRRRVEEVGDESTVETSDVRQAPRKMGEGLGNKYGVTGDGEGRRVMVVR
jgi:hypothetical protein